MRVKYLLLTIGGLALSALSLSTSIPFTGQWTAGATTTVMTKTPMPEGSEWENVEVPTICNTIDTVTCQSYQLMYFRIYQTEAQIKNTNEFIAVTSTTPIAESYYNPIKDMHHLINVSEMFLKFVTANSRTDYERYGKFKFKIIEKNSSAGTETKLYEIEWKWTYQMAGQNGSTDSSGISRDAIRNALGLYGSDSIGDALEKQNSNQKGFWESMFVPDPVDVEDLKTQAMKFANWGPFGIYGAVKGEFDNGTIHTDNINTANNEGKQEFEKSYVINFAGYDMDLSPYAPFIRFVRLLLSASLWMTVIFAIWRWVGKKV
jgi:hypothetical protein